MELVVELKVGLGAMHLRYNYHQPTTFLGLPGLPSPYGLGGSGGPTQDPTECRPMEGRQEMLSAQPLSGPEAVTRGITPEA